MKKTLFMLLCVLSIVVTPHVYAERSSVSLKVGETYEVTDCHRSTTDKNNGSGMSNSSVASLSMGSGKYIITAKSVGTSKFTCDEAGFLGFGNWSMDIQVADANGSVSEGYMDVKVGETKEVYCDRSTEDGGNDSKIGNSSIATLSKKNGKYYITGVSTGTTDFTCDVAGFLAFGNKTIHITVLDEDGHSEYGGKSVNIREGEKATIECERPISDGGNGSKIKDTSIATLDTSSGQYVVTGKKKGNTVFTCDVKGYFAFGNYDIAIHVVDADAKDADSSEDGKRPGYEDYEDEDVKDPLTGQFYNPTTEVGENFCAEPAVRQVLRFFGYFLMVARLFVPLIIVIHGTFIFFKAVTSDKDSDLKKSGIVFGRKIFIGLLVFFVPTLIDGVFGLYNAFSQVESEYTSCKDCLIHPTKCASGGSGGTKVDKDEDDEEKTTLGLTAESCEAISYSQCSKYRNCKVESNGGNAPICVNK